MESSIGDAGSHERAMPVESGLGKQPLQASSRSRSVCETMEGTHKFTVQGFSLLKGAGPGHCVTSDTFAAGGYEWAVHFYPDGKNAEDNSLYTSVFIALASEGVDVRALFEIVMIDQTSKGQDKVHSHFRRKLDGGPYSLKRKGSMWGYKRYYRTSSLETSHYLKDDCLLMHCRVGVVRSRLEAPGQFSIPMPAPDIGRCLKEFLHLDIGSDIVFEVGNEKFKAHKQILAARSPVFMAQFFGPLGNSRMERIVLVGMEPSIFKAMLLYIYSDEFPDISELTGSTSKSTTILILQHLLEAADKYDLKRLKKICEAKLSGKLTVDTVAATLAFAERHQCSQLKSVCLRFSVAKENLGALVQSEWFDGFAKDYPSIVWDILDTVANAEESSSPIYSLKRSSSSCMAQNGIEDSAAKRRRT